MTDTPFSFWTSQDTAASFSEPGACETRATAFDKKIKRRNIIEYAAGGLGIVLFGGLTFASIVAGDWLMATSGLTVMLGVAFIIWKLKRDGSSQPRLPEQACREHLRGELVRQRDLLRGVPKWYLGPLIPGLLGFYLVVTAKMAEQQGWLTAIAGVWDLVAITAALFVIVGWLNIHSAKKIDREIGALDRA